MVKPEKRGAWSGTSTKKKQKDENIVYPPGWSDVQGPLWRQNFEYHSETKVVRCKICRVTARGLYYSNMKLHLNAKHPHIADCMNATIKKYAEADPDDF